VAVTVPATDPAVATVTWEIPAWVAASSPSATGRAYLNGSAMGRSSRGTDVVVVEDAGGWVVVVAWPAGGVVPPAGMVVVVVGGRVVVVVVDFGTVGAGVGWPSTASMTSRVRPR